MENVSRAEQARRLLAEGKTPNEIGKSMGLKHFGWIYSMKKKITGATEPGKRGRKPGKASAVKPSTDTGKLGHYFVAGDFPVAFASENLGHRYLGEAAKLTKVAVILN